MRAAVLFTRMMDTNQNIIIMTNENRNKTMAYVSPEILENIYSPEGVLCASEWSVQTDNMEYEKYEW
jgi:hypothetical protein